MTEPVLLGIRGAIDRRIMVNYRIDLDVLAEELPAPFRPQTVDDYGIGGICLIRLGNLRPRGVPAALGLTSENAAHRFAVEWDDGDDTRSGIYVSRRDTDSRLNSMLGGTLFPGVFNPASFDVDESDGQFEIAMASEIDGTRTTVTGEPGASLPDDSVFESLRAASAFQESGSMGYSPTEHGDEFDAMDLHIPNWEVKPFSVESVDSSYFEDLVGAEFDNALLMEDAYHEWREGDPVSASGTA